MIINKTETFAKLIVLTCIQLNTNWHWMLVWIVYIAYLPNGKFNDILYLSSLIKLKINESGVNMYACIYPNRWWHISCYAIAYRIVTHFNRQIKWRLSSSIVSSWCGGWLNHFQFSFLLSDEITFYFWNVGKVICQISKLSGQLKLLS